MATTSPTGRMFAVPDLVGFKAAHAVDALRDLGLTAVPLPSPVPDVTQAGLVLGMDPPPNSPVRPKARITLSVGSHPDFDGRGDTLLEAAPTEPVQPPLNWPQSAPTGLAEPEPDFHPRAFGVAGPTAAAPNAPVVPAAEHQGTTPPSAVVPSGSSATPVASGAAADPSYIDLSAVVPTPGEMDEWDRMRAAELEREQSQHAPAGTPQPSAPSPIDTVPAVVATPVDDSARRADEEKARREARRRSARRHRRLTIKQKVMVGVVLLFTIILVVAAASGHKPARRPTAATKTHKAHARAAHPAAHKAISHKRTPPTKRPRTRVVKVVKVVTRARTHVVTVTRTTTTPTPATPPVSTPSTYVPPSHTDSTAIDTTPSTDTATQPAGSSSTTPSSPKPASTHASTKPSSHGTTGGGSSTLKSPDGATAPPQP